MDQIPTPGRHRRRRRSTARRVARGLGFGARRGWLRLAVVTASLCVALAALWVALGVAPGSPAGAPPAVVAAGTPAPASTASPRPASPGATLPAVPGATPSALPSAAPEGTVATRIRIERLGIDLRIVEGDGIDAPLHKAAHYPGSGWPGGGTNIYLYAHAQDGMFLPLWDARVGDRVVLELAGGGEAAYTVTDVRPKVPWNAVWLTEPTPDERLSLQTSTSYTPTAPRFLVIAEPVP